MIVSHAGGMVVQLPTHQVLRCTFQIALLQHLLLQINPWHSRGWLQ
jgi:hypothetical protein